MWLLVLAPIVSHIDHAGQDLSVPFCSVASESGGHAVGMEHVRLAEDHGDSSTDLLTACGYCHLLEHHAVLPSPPVHPAVTPLLLSTFIAPFDVAFTPTGAFPSGRPRDPPRLS